MFFKIVFLLLKLSHVAELIRQEMKDAIRNGNWITNLLFSFGGGAKRPYLQTRHENASIIGRIKNSNITFQSWEGYCWTNSHEKSWTGKMFFVCHCALKIEWCPISILFSNLYFLQPLCCLEKFPPLELLSSSSLHSQIANRKMKILWFPCHWACEKLSRIERVIKIASELLNAGLEHDIRVFSTPLDIKFHGTRKQKSFFVGFIFGKSFLSDLSQIISCPCH